jgi:hypothetical protein
MGQGNPGGKHQARVAQPGPRSGKVPVGIWLGAPSIE